MRAYVTNTGDGTVSVIDAEANSLVTTVKVGAAPLGVTVTPNAAAHPWYKIRQIHV